MRHDRLAREVIGELFDVMEATVHSYGDGAIKVAGRIEGTSFFPGGAGLWRGAMSRGRLPQFFPNNPILILAHNFDSQKGHKDSIARGVERMNHGTWKWLLEYLHKTPLEASRCFFTNALVGLQPLKAEGKMYAPTSYYEECRNFLVCQIQIVRPQMIVVLGEDAHTQFDLIQCGIPSVKLRHPGNFRFIKSVNRESVAVEQAKKLAKALHIVPCIQSVGTDSR